MDTLFELPEMFLYAALVSWVDETFPRNERRKWYEKAYEDLRGSIDQVHRDGSLKGIIMADPGTYIVRDPHLAETLADFRAVQEALPDDELGMGIHQCGDVLSPRRRGG